MRRTVTTLAATILVLGMAACMPTQRPHPADAADPALVLDLPSDALETLRSAMVGLQGEPLVDAGHGDCAATGFDLPGQEYRILGAGGPFALAGGAGGAVDAGLVATPGQVAVQLAALDGFALNEGNVTLLVLDDFGMGGAARYRIDGSATQKVLLAALDALPPGASDASRDAAVAAAARQLVTDGQLSHGGLVLEHVLALLRALGGTVRTVDETTYSVAFDATGAVLTVQAVDVGSSFQSVEAVRDRMVAAVSEAADRQVPVVVNMSFAVVPCDVTGDFAKNRERYPTFESYVAALADVPANRAVLEKRFDLRLSVPAAATLIGAAVSLPVASDPLGAYLAEAGTGSTTRYVASSGNYGLAFSLYPAAWPQVLGVGSRDVSRDPLDPASKSTFSDAAELVAGGAYFALAGLVDPSTAPTLPAFVYAGTSFSAPAISVLVAADLLTNPPRCGLSATGVPVLAGPQDDTPIESAYPARCLP